MIERSSADTNRLRRWQSLTVASLFTGYAGYYICRSNLSVATPLLLDEYASEGLTKSHIGDVASLGVLAYAGGKLVNGIAADYFGGRRLFLIGMFASVICTILFAFSPAFADGLSKIAISFGLSIPVLMPFFIFWGLNRFVQSMGWGGLIQMTSRWFSAARLATVMGILSMSYLLGDALARLYLGFMIQLGLGWRGVFFAAAAALSVIGIGCLASLKRRPSDLGLPEPPPPTGNVFGDDHGHGQLTLKQHLGPLLGSFAFWLVCLMNIGLTLIRETFNLWNPTYLNQVVRLDPGMAGMTSLVFPLVGAVSSFLAGWLADRLNNRYGLVAIGSLIGLGVVLVALAFLPLATYADGTREVLAVTLIASAAFFLLAPYTFCSGVLALKLGGQRGGSTSAGLIDTAGYLGATIAGSGIGRIAEHHGWGNAFLTLAGVTIATLIFAGIYAIRETRTVPENIT